MDDKLKQRNLTQGIVKSSAIIMFSLSLFLIAFGNKIINFFHGDIEVVEVVEVVETVDTIKRTTLEILNTSEHDSVLTYLTIGSDTNFVTDVNGIFGINDSGLQGSFWLVKDSLYTYEFNNKGLSGNFSFDTVPLNCPAGTFKTGTNLFEVTINNYGTVSKAQETIDISNVAGVNAMCRYSMVGGGTWIAGGDSVSSFGNSSIYNNVDSVGVFPFGCDNCTSSVKPPKCIDTLKISKPQPRHICNVSRNSKESGGTIRLSFMGFTQ